jgi:type I restriction enzyme R subunit
MVKPGEHKTVQLRILAYAQEIGWTYVPRDEAERRRGFTAHPGPHPSPLPEGEGMSSGERGNTDEARKESLFFGDLIDQLMTAQIRGQDLDLPKLTSFTAKGAR